MKNILQALQIADSYPNASLEADHDVLYLLVPNIIPVDKQKLKDLGGFLQSDNEEWWEFFV